MNENTYSTSSVDDEFNLFEVPNLTGSPERRLLLAVLERAILDYVGNDKREVEAAEQWLFGELSEPTLEEFSFPWLCEELDLDMHSIAKMIYEMPKRGSRKIAPWYFAKTAERGVTTPPEKPGVVTRVNFRAGTVKSDEAIAS